jgi:2-C-methyl-D-erythritol 2,4-cyclodiphosphate synthase
MKIRIGHGFDVHRLVAGRELWLGGIRIDHDKGLDGHSDADVLIHAICDAMLGALALGDIGTHFPDTDIRYKDADSKLLLERVYEKLKKSGWSIGNIDSTIIAQQPRIAPHIPKMILALSNVLKINPTDISIKATTTEGMGYEGRGEGISAHAIVLIQKTV